MTNEARRSAIPTSVTLLLNLIDGSTREVAAEEFYRCYEGVVRGYARLLGANWDEVEEITHEVLERFVMHKAFEFRYDRTKGRFRGYLFRFTNRVVREFARAKATQSSIRSLTELDDTDPIFARHWNFAWESNLIPRALTRLERECEQSGIAKQTFDAFRRTALERYSVDEVMDDFRMTRSAVDNARHTLKTRLFAIMAEHDPLDL